MTRNTCACCVPNAYVCAKKQLPADTNSFRGSVSGGKEGGGVLNWVPVADSDGDQDSW